MRFMNLMSIGAALALAACTVTVEDSDKSGTGTNNTNNTNNNNNNNNTETASGETGGGFNSGSTEAYAAFFGAQFGVDGSGNVSAFTDAVYGYASDPSVVIILVDDSFANQCVMVISNAGAVNSSWDGSAMFGWEMDYSTNSLAFNDCDGWTVLGGYDPVELMPLLSYQFSLKPLGADVADFIDSYPDYYYGSDSAVGMAMNIVDFLYEPAELSAVAYAADASMSTDFSQMLPASAIFSGSGVSSAVYVQNNYVGILVY